MCIYVYIYTHRHTYIYIYTHIYMAILMVQTVKHLPVMQENSWLEKVPWEWQSTLIFFPGAICIYKHTHTYTHIHTNTHTHI